MLGHVCVLQDCIVVRFSQSRIERESLVKETVISNLVKYVYVGKDVENSFGESGVKFVGLRHSRCGEGGFQTWVK